MLEELKKRVLDANLKLVEYGLVVLTWGNASEISDDRKYVVIKPSGVSYAAMRAEDMVVVDIDGNVVEGKLRPSSDLPTHLELYRNFGAVKGVVHTHSRYAVALAQAEQAATASKATPKTTARLMPATAATAATASPQESAVQTAKASPAQLPAPARSQPLSTAQSAWQPAP